MKKLNNKGITIVELIISFSILMVIAIGMLNVVNEIRGLQKLIESRHFPAPALPVSGSMGIISA